MRMTTLCVSVFQGVLIATLFAQTASAQSNSSTENAYLAWSAPQAEAVIKSMTVKGRVPGTRRVLNTEQAQSYKLRAVWITPEVLRAAARLLQLRERLSEEQTRRLVTKAEAAGVLIVLVELDPDEGSGVIPPSWGAFLQPMSAAPDSGSAARGIEKRNFDDIRLFDEVLPRNYDYDRFWMLFLPEIDSGKPVFGPTDRDAELIVQIRGKEAKVHWPIPDSIRQRMAAQHKANP